MGSVLCQCTGAERISGLTINTHTFEGITSKGSTIKDGESPDFLENILDGRVLAE